MQSVQRRRAQGLFSHRVSPIRQMCQSLHNLHPASSLLVAKPSLLTGSVAIRSGFSVRICCQAPLPVSALGTYGFRSSELTSGHAYKGDRDFSMCRMIRTEQKRILPDLETSTLNFHEALTSSGQFPGHTLLLRILSPCLDVPRSAPRI